jgi:hypothetical protein
MYKIDMKLQYKSKPLEIKSEKRYLLYRVEPSELTWWQRIFKNPWRYAFTAYNNVLSSDNSVNDCLCYLFDSEEANEFIAEYDTYEKLADFLTEEYNKAKSKYYEAQEKYYNKNSWKI